MTMFEVAYRVGGSDMHRQVAVVEAANKDAAIAALSKDVSITVEYVHETSSAKQQARAQAASISEMVAALECDYERLEELRDERKALTDELKYQEARGEDADAIRTREALKVWDDDNGEELAELEEAAGDCTSREDAEQRIREDALSVEIRSGWQSVGEELTPEEFRIVLCTGGPHVEILGELDANNTPDRVRIRYSDWNDSGELFDFNHEAVLTYAQQFFFGE